MMVRSDARLDWFRSALEVIRIQWPHASGSPNGTAGQVLLSSPAQRSNLRWTSDFSSALGSPYNLRNFRDERSIEQSIRLLKANVNRPKLEI